MAIDKRQLKNVISRLVKQGKSTRYIFTYLKSDKKFKYANTKAINTQIDDSRLAYSRGKAANALTKDKTIGDIFSKDKKKRPKRICVDYDFKHNAKGKVSRSSGPGSDMLGSIEVDTTLTIGEVRTAILSRIQEWLDRYYQTSNKRSIRASIQITTIQEC
jgi:hypothetical protein